MNEPNQVSDGRVYAGDQVWPNIFEAVGFPPEEAARMLAAVDAEIDARRRQARVVLAAAGKTKRARWARYPAGRSRA